MNTQHVAHKATVIQLFCCLCLPLVVWADGQRPGPSLTVYVYSSGGTGTTGQRLHGAQVKLTDDWGYFQGGNSSGPRIAESQTNAGGIARFSPADFTYWTIAEGKRYNGADPWDWLAAPRMLSGSSTSAVTGSDRSDWTNRKNKNSVTDRSGPPLKNGETSVTRQDYYTPGTPAVFKVKVEVNMDGFESKTKWVQISGPGAEFAVYLNSRAVGNAGVGSVNVAAFSPADTRPREDVLNGVAVFVMFSQDLNAAQRLFSDLVSKGMKPGKIVRFQRGPDSEYESSYWKTITAGLTQKAKDAAEWLRSNVVSDFRITGFGPAPVDFDSNSNPGPDWVELRVR